MPSSMALLARGLRCMSYLRKLPGDVSGIHDPNRLSLKTNALEGTYIMSETIDVESTRNVINLLKRLRAVRQFRPDPIPQEVVDGVLDVARWSGSASNRQPWEFVVIRNKETLGVLSKLEGFAAHLAGASVGIVLVMVGDKAQEEQETYDEGR